MNCKPGDLAIVIWARAAATIPVGSIVRCVRFYAGMALVQSESKRKHVETWIVEHRGQVSEDGWLWNVPDAHLRPIRDIDGEDEALQWAPLPVKEIA